MRLGVVVRQQCYTALKVQTGIALGNTRNKRPITINPTAVNIKYHQIKVTSTSPLTMSEMLSVSPKDASLMKPGRHPAVQHVKKPLVPLTVIGEEGTAKRNIIRKGGLSKARKDCAPGLFSFHTVHPYFATAVTATHQKSFVKQVQ